MNEPLNKKKSIIAQLPQGVEKEQGPRSPIDIPDGLFFACEGCHKAIYQKVLVKTLFVCPHCQYHFKLNARDRLASIVDDQSFNEHFAAISSLNPLQMLGYDEKLKDAQASTHNPEAFLCGLAEIEGIKVAIGVLDAFFMMGSMGSAVGEKITRLIELSISEKCPLVIFSASGGARMQEGIYSLMQMVKTSAALSLHNQAGLLYVSILTNPTTGGVAASFASLGDIIISEEGALIGFAGPRVIKQTIHQELPEGFQTANFQLRHGQLDLVVKRSELKATLAKILKFHQYGKKI